MTKAKATFPLCSHMKDKFQEKTDVKNKMTIQFFESWLQTAREGILQQLEDKAEAKIYSEDNFSHRVDEVERFVNVARDFFRALDYKFVGNNLHESFVPNRHLLFTISLF